MPGRLRRHGDDDDHDVGVRQQLRQLRGRPDAVPGGAGHVGQLDVEAGEHPADRRGRCRRRRRRAPARRRARRASRTTTGRRPARGRRTGCRAARPASRPPPTPRSTACARPRALHSSTPSGSRPTNRSAPALSSCTSRSRGSASRKPLSGSVAPPLRGTQTCARGRLAGRRRRRSASTRWARTRGDSASDRRSRWRGRAPARAAARRGRGSGAARAPTLGGRPDARTYCETGAASGRECGRPGCSPSCSPAVARSTGCGDDGYHPVGPFRPLPEGAPPEVGPPTSQAPRARAIPPSPSPGEDGRRPQRRRLRPDRAHRAGRPARRQRDRRRAGHRPAAAGLPRPLARRAS